MTNNAYELAKADLGTWEWKDGHNPVVLGYFADAGHSWVKDDETAWCAAFVGAMLRRAGYDSTGELTARSYLKWGKPVDRKDAREGDVVVFERGNSSWQGHVAFLVLDRGSTMDVLGGNQRNQVNVSGYDSRKVLGIRRHPAWDAKAPAPAPTPPAKPAPAPAPSPGRSGGIVAAILAALAAAFAFFRK